MKWEEVRLENVAEIKGGKRLPSGHKFTSNTVDNPYIRARDIKNGRITIIEPVFINENTYSFIKQYIVSEKDICLTIVGAYCGDIGVVPKELDGANLTENAVRIRTNDQICYQIFLAYYLQLKHIQRLMKQMSDVSAQPKLGIYKVKSIPIPLPPLPIQKKIASILSAYDDLIENNLRRIELLEQSARELYKEWFVRFKFPGHEKVKMADGLPEGWERKKLGDIAELTSSKRIYAKEYVEKGIPFYRSKEIIKKYNHDAISDLLYISIEKYKEIKDKYGIPEINDILITSVGTLGIPFLVRTDDEFYFKDGNLIWYRKIFPHLVLYLYNWIQSAVGKASLLKMVIGTSQKAFTIVNLKNTDIIIPEKDIINQYHHLTIKIDKQITNLTNQNQLLKQARDLLLPRLMKGEIEV